MRPRRPHDSPQPVSHTTSCEPKLSFSSGAPSKPPPAGRPTMILNAPLHLRRPCPPASRHPKPSVSSPTLIALPRGLLARRACAHSPLRHVASPPEEERPGEAECGEEDEDLGPASAAAVAAAIRRASNASPVRFRRMRLGESGEAPRGEDGGVAAPSSDFRRLCAEQLEMFRAVVSRDAVLSVSPDLCAI